MLKTITFIRTITLCLAMLMMGGKVKGQTKTEISGNPIINFVSGTLTYGIAGSATYSIEIPTTYDLNNKGSVTFTLIGTLPSGATISDKIFTLTKGLTSTKTTFTISSTTSTPPGTTINLAFVSGIYTSNSFSFAINQKPLNVTSTTTVASKVYNGTSDATVSGGVTGVINQDIVSLSTSGTFSDKNVGTAKKVTFYLTGTNAGKYTLIQPNITGNITAKSLSVNGTIIPNNKTYDGKTTATVTATNLTWTGFIQGDVIDLAYNFGNSNVGDAKPITCTLSGTDAGNYAFTAPTGLKANITPMSLTVINTVINDKTYDGTLTATIKTPGALSGLVSGETNAPTLTESYAFPDKNVGLKTLNASCSISGGGGNYTLTQPTTFTARINQAPLTVSDASVTTKVFDGTTSATITGGVLSGLVSGEGSVVTLANPGTGTFSDSNVGQNKPVTANYSISGSGINNYSFTQPTLLGNITPPTVVAWSGTTSTDWGTAGNWTPPYLPDATVDVTITNAHPVIAANTTATCKNLTIDATSGLTIAPKGSLTVSGNLINNNASAAASLSLLSDATYTGSLIVNGSASGSGTASVVRYMTPGLWHLISSPLAPLSNETIGTFLLANQSIPFNKQAGAPTVYPLERAMRAYDGLNKRWGDFYKEDTSEKLTTGKGYSIRVKSSTGTQRVTFTGKLQPGTQTVAVTANEWSCVGNPYTSALNISGTNSFLAANNSKMPDAFKCVYVWDAASNAYSQINNTITNQAVQQGQAFMIALMPGNTSVSFTPAMQTHDVTLALKSTEDIWPSINLSVIGDSINSSTTVAFHDGMTNGLDPSYDAGLLSAGGPELYTRLVDDYGIPFDIQALPSDQYDQLIIPVGVDYKKGGEVTFSAKGMYLPSSCRPILEDRLTGIKTDLTDKTYTVDLSANTAGTGRFYLYTSYSSTGVDSRENNHQLTAWAQGNNEINIKGQINNGAIASLFDLQGRLIATHVMREGVRERFSLPAVKPGIYLLQVRNQQKTEVMKVRFGE